LSVIHLHENISNLFSAASSWSEGFSVGPRKVAQIARCFSEYFSTSLKH